MQGWFLLTPSVYSLTLIASSLEEGAFGMCLTSLHIASLSREVGFAKQKPEGVASRLLLFSSTPQSIRRKADFTWRSHISHCAGSHHMSNRGYTANAKCELISALLTRHIAVNYA